MALRRDISAGNDNRVKRRHPDSRRESFLEVWSEHFVFAGLSATMLAVARMSGDYWFLSFVAMLPFLYRASTSSPRGGLRLGALFGIAYLLSIELDRLIAQPERAILEVPLGILLCSLLGWSISWSRNRWGFNPLIISLIWFVFQLSLARLAGIISLFGNIEVTLPACKALSTLVGTAVVSPLVVLANGMLLWVAGTTSLVIAKPSLHSIEAADRAYIDSPSFFHAGFTVLVHDNRAPPSCSHSRFANADAGSVTLHGFFLPITGNGGTICSGATGSWSGWPRLRQLLC